MTHDPAPPRHTPPYRHATPASGHLAGSPYTKGPPLDTPLKVQVGVCVCALVFSTFGIWAHMATHSLVQDLPNWCALAEKSLPPGPGPFLVGGKVSLADILFYTLLLAPGRFRLP